MLPSVAPRVAVELVTGTVLEALVLLRVVPRVSVRLVTSTVLKALVLLSVVPVVAVELATGIVIKDLYCSASLCRHHAGSKKCCSASSYPVSP